VVDEHSVSRVHARLHFGETIAIEDAGSSNGTRVGAAELGAGQRCRLRPGQVAELGHVLVIIDAPSGATGMPEPGAEPLASGQAPAPDRGSASGQVIVLDEAMIALHRLVGRIAGGSINVLLVGETGAGKEVLAEQIHVRSRRCNGPFLRLNCAALVEPLVESELFGHEKGAFTGAMRSKPGLFECAAGGTVFLDEIGEMPLALQAKLLRVIDERQVWPVGSLKPRPIDVRLVAATNRVLEDEIERGRFRQDLYFRLSGVTLRIPALRQRPREILVLADAFVARAAAGMGLPRLQLTSEARSALARHPWPGNVRELKNAIERAALLAHGEEIDVAELGLDAVRSAAEAASSVGPSPRASPGAGAEPIPGADHGSRGEGTLHDELDAVERQRILETLEACGGNQSEAARRLGMSRSTLGTRLDRYGTPRPRRSMSAR
jgi:two-component system response regulator AtoC